MSPRQNPASKPRVTVLGIIMYIGFAWVVTRGFY